MEHRSDVSLLLRWEISHVERVLLSDCLYVSVCVLELQNLVDVIHRSVRTVLVSEISLWSLVMLRDPDGLPLLRFSRCGDRALVLKREERLAAFFVTVLLFEINRPFKLSSILLVVGLDLWELQILRSLILRLLSFEDLREILALQKFLWIRGFCVLLNLSWQLSRIKSSRVLVGV